MLLNIHSKHIFKYTVSFIDIKKLLKLINYNKELQGKIDININYYRKISQKILKIDENGIGRIYDIINNDLIFEGEYFNKKKNGKGKEYKDYILLSKLAFEGEFKDGKRNGNGKEYNLLFPGKLLEYDGEYKNDLRNGYGKIYDGNQNLIFEGEFLNGKKWGGIYKSYIND